jgi:hypothetical protein
LQRRSRRGSGKADKEIERGVLGVVVGEVEIGVGAVEDDDVQFPVAFDHVDPLGHLRHR